MIHFKKENESYFENDRQKYLSTIAEFKNTDNLKTYEFLAGIKSQINEIQFSEWRIGCIRQCSKSAEKNLFKLAD